MFESLVEFSKRTLPGAAVAGHIKSPFSEVPTALLLTGVNAPDHERVYQQLAAYCSVGCWNVATADRYHRSTLALTLSQLTRPEERDSRR